MISAGQLNSVALNIRGIGIQGSGIYVDSDLGAKNNAKTGKMPVSQPPPPTQVPVEENMPGYYRYAPAVACVFIFVSGSLSILLWERRKENLKKMA